MADLILITILKEKQEVVVLPNGSDPESLLEDEKNHKILVPIYLYTQVIHRSTGTIVSSYVDPDMMLKDESTKKPVSYQQLQTPDSRKAEQFLETIYRYL